MEMDNIFGILDDDSSDSIFSSDENTDNVISLSDESTILDDMEKNETPTPTIDLGDAESLLEEMKPVEEETAEEEEVDEVSTFEEISKELVELGVFSEDEEQELPKTGEDFAKRFETETTKKANTHLSNFLSKFGEDRLAAFNAIFVNGVDPKEYFSIATEQEDLFSLDMEQESNQEKVVRKYYLEHLGHSEVRANKMIAMLKEDGELDAEATEALSKFSQKRDEKLAQTVNQKALEEQRKIQEKQVFNQTVDSFIEKQIQSKELGGFKFDKNIADNVKRKLTQDAWRLPSGETITDFQKFVLDLKRPENIEFAIKIALLQENNFDFSKVQLKKAELEKNKAFSKLTQKTKTINRNSPTKLDEDNFFI